MHSALAALEFLRLSLAEVEAETGLTKGVPIVATSYRIPSLLYLYPESGSGSWTPSI